jgi:hypothetical protein
MRAERRIELTPEKVNGEPAVGNIVCGDERKGSYKYEARTVDGQPLHGVNDYPAKTAVSQFPGYSAGWECNDPDCGIHPR